MEIRLNIKGSLKDMQKLFHKAEVLSVRFFNRTNKDNVFEVCLRLAEDVKYRGKSVKGWLEWDEAQKRAWDAKNRLNKEGKAL